MMALGFELARSMVLLSAWHWLNRRQTDRRSRAGPRAVSGRGWLVTRYVSWFQWRWRASSFALVATIGCGDPSGRVIQSHPKEFVGRWARRLDKGVWGDTLELRDDGTVRGSATNRVPASARWSMQTNSLGMKALCMSDSAVRSCQPFRFYDSLLILNSGPQGETYFRRTP
jgi:hypothetical protein